MCGHIQEVRHLSPLVAAPVGCGLDQRPVIPVWKLGDMIPWGEFKIEVIYFPRGAPRGDTQGGPQGGCPWGGSGELFGLPIRRINPRIRPQGYFFMLRSILPLPDLKILLKLQKITKN